MKSLFGTLGAVLASGGELSSEEIIVRESLNGRVVSKKVVKIDDKGSMSFGPHPTFPDVIGFTIPPFKATATIR